MIINKLKLFFWLVTAITIGFSLGYLFSSKFCSINIDKRVAKLSTLNQTLQTLFIKQAVVTHGFLRSQFFGNADANAIDKMLIQNHQEIGSILNRYYGATAGNTIIGALNEQKKLLEAAQSIHADHQDIKNRMNEETKKLSEYLTTLNPEWSCAGEFAHNVLSAMGANYLEIIKLQHEKKWQQCLVVFEKNLAIALQSADELDRTITQQFKHKF